MIPHRTYRVRRPPSGRGQVFVIYDRETGAIVGLHHLLTSPTPAASPTFTEEKQRAAARSLDEALLRRAAATAGIPASRVRSLRVRGPMADPSRMRVDVARSRLVRVRARAGGPRLSTLEPPRRARKR
jgi:hypothetical protein